MKLLLCTLQAGTPDLAMGGISLQLLCPAPMMIFVGVSLFNDTGFFELSSDHHSSGVFNAPFSES